MCEAILSVKEWNRKMKIKQQKRTVQSRRYGVALAGLAPQTKLQAPQIEMWNTINRWNFG